MEHNRRCLATGKVSFPNMVEARIVIYSLKWGHKRFRDIYGKRIKHRQGRPQQKRAYYCSHCQGYHLTRWTRNDFKEYREWQESEIWEERTR